MILLPTSEIEWDSVNRKALEEFLQSPTGQRLINVLANFQPSYGDGADNKTLVAAGKVEGYAEAVMWLVRLTKEHPVDKKAPTKKEYPDLDDGQAWEALDKSLADPS